MRAFVALLLLAGCATVNNEGSGPVHVVWQKVDDVQAATDRQGFAAAKGTPGDPSRLGLAPYGIARIAFDA